MLTGQTYCDIKVKIILYTAIGCNKLGLPRPVGRGRAFRDLIR